MQVWKLKFWGRVAQSARPPNVIEKVIKENNLDVKLTKVDDIMEMVNYHIMTTPAVVVDEVVKMKGQVPTESDVKKLLGIG